MTNDELNRQAKKAADELQGRIEQGPVQEQISEHSEVFDDMAEYEAADQLVDESRKAAKSRAWMWVAVAIALLIGAAIFVLMMPGTNKADRAVSYASNATSTAVNKATDAVSGTISEVVEVINTGVDNAAAAVKNSADTVASVTTGVASKVSASVAETGNDLNQATIDKEARQVIHGDFGNGSQRRQALGSHYAAVQHRVNELMHG